VPRQRGWSSDPLVPHQWQSADPHDRAGNTAAQDAAAGGRARRQVETDSGQRARGRIRFVRKAGARRTYAYLVWTDHGRREEFLIDDVTATHRAANLRAAWDTVHQHKLTTRDGRQRWRDTATHRR
jgi:hypothetical protein